MKRGEIWWADLPTPTGSAPGFPRPVLIIQADPFNRSAINTVIIAIITSNLRLAEAPGNVLLSQRNSHLEKDSVVNVSQILTIDRNLLKERVATLSDKKMRQIENGIRLVLGIP